MPGPYVYMMDKTAVVIDNGSYSCKAGFAGKDGPTVELRSIVGVPRSTASEFFLPREAVFLGEEALRRRGVLTLKYPIEQGVVTDWDSMEKVTRFSAHRPVPLLLYVVLITESGA